MDTRYEVRYQDGYYVVVDTQTDQIVSSSANHYKRYRDGYLWANAAIGEARDLEAAAIALEAR